MKYTFTIQLLILFSFAAFSQNVGIGTSTPTKGRLEIFGALGGGTVASFGTDGTGISIQRNWPTIGFNQYRDNSNIARYMGNGKASWLYYEPTGGSFGWDVYDVGGVADQAITAIGTRALSILSNGNIGIRSSGTTDASLWVERKNNLLGSAVLGGTTHNSHFSWGNSEDTYIRGGKNGSKVIVNDVPGGKNLVYGQTAMGNYGTNNYAPVATAEIWGAMVLKADTVNLANYNNQPITVGDRSFLVLNFTSPSSIDGIVLSDGLRTGQLLILVVIENFSPASPRLFLPYYSGSTTNISVASDFYAQSGDTITLIWVGSQWLEVARGDGP